jgi:hypothetical protein
VKKWHARTALSGAAAAALLALAPAASAAFEPVLTATSAGDTVTLSYSQAAANDGTAVLAFYAPATYRAKLPTAVGSVVGSATGTGVAADLRGSTLPLDGTIRVASPTTPLAAGSATTLGDAAQACAGSSTLDSTWTLSLNVFDVTVPLAIGVQHVGSGQEPGGIALFVCPPPADVPAATPGRAPLGLKVVHLTLRLSGLFTVPAGTHVWHLKATPYAPGTARPNPAAAAEAEAEQAAPPLLTLAAKASGAVSGRLTVAGRGVGGRTVQLWAAGRRVGRATTKSSGAFAATVAPRRLPATLTAKVVVPARYVACTSPAFAPLPCTTSIVSGFATSARARVAR